MRRTIQDRSDVETDDERKDVLKDESPKSSYPSRKERWRTILPLMGFTCCFYIGVIGWTTLLPQYILARLRKGNHNSTVTTDDICHVNESDPAYQEEKRLQQTASEITSTAAFCGGIPAVIVVLIYSSISDQLGRKVTIAIPYVGGSLVSIVIALLVNFDLPFWTYILASFLNGFSGSYSTLFAGVFATVADVTPPELRSVYIAIIEGSLGLAMLLANLLVGLWAKYAGYSQPIIFLSALICCSGIFFCVIRETRPKEQILIVRQQSLCRAIRKQLAHIGTTLTRDRLRMKQILVLAFAFMLSMLSYMGMMSTLTLYVMGQPFCWDAGGIGIYNSMKTAVIMIGAVVAVAILRRKISDFGLTVIGVISFLGMTFLTGFASFFETSFHDVMMIIAIFVGLLTSVPMITLRGLSSTLVTSEEQGSLFGLIAIGETFSISFGPVIMNGIYAATVTSLSASVFFFCDGLLILLLLILATYKVCLSNRRGYEELDGITDASTQSSQRTESVSV